uniref:Uncharacterized protein n=1 Tax=Rhizophora mucronata TaxID=61149 RepID=A0A2P2NDD4_RHIMU
MLLRTQQGTHTDTHTRTPPSPVAQH